MHNPFRNMHLTKLTYNMRERAKRASAQNHYVFSFLRNVRLLQVIIRFITVAYIIASFLVFGGRARPQNVQTEKPKSRICILFARASEASECLRNIYFCVSKYLLYTSAYIFNQCSSILIRYDAINDSIPTKH